MLGTWKTRLVAGLVVAALAAVAALTAAAQSSASIGCTGFLPPGFYGDTIEVPAGADCESPGGVIIHAGVIVHEGATFVLGSEDSPGPLSFIYGAFRANNAANVQLHFMTLIGGLFILGGSGPFGGPFGVTWNTIEDSKILGDTIIIGYDGFWQGFIRNHTRGQREASQQRRGRSGRQRGRHELDPRNPELLRQRPGPAGRRLRG
jgi:hypothetical protein